jgi:hypothetical protein
MTLTISCRNGSVKQIVPVDTGRALLKVGGLFPAFAGHPPPDLMPIL